MLELKIKVCGMRDTENIRQLLELKLDYMGFIFYPESARFVETIEAGLLDQLSAIKKTAVFVNARIEEVKEIVSKYSFQVVQLHGNESPDYCIALKEEGLEVIKAFGVHPDFEWAKLMRYEEIIDYFLFDTFTKSHGGSGKTFDWEVLHAYSLSTPYFLSGGIGPEEMKRAFEIKDDRFYGLDLNSRFERSPGMKNIELLTTVLKKNYE